MVATDEEMYSLPNYRMASLRMFQALRVGKKNTSDIDDRAFRDLMCSAGGRADGLPYIEHLVEHTTYGQLWLAMP